MKRLTIVFDLDGTLVDTAPDLVAATNHALADLSLDPVPVAALRPFVSHGARRMIEEGLRVSGRPLPPAEIDRLLEMFLKHYEANIARDSRPFAGAPEALRALKTSGARLAVCTNKREGLSRKLLAELGLDTLFDGLAGRDTFPVSKPHPDHLLGAVRLAGGEESRAIMIGDTNIDLATARAAALPAILVQFGYSPTPVAELAPDVVLERFSDLASAISRIAARWI